MRDDDNDRQAILARRAIFVTTALAAFGCSSNGQTTATSNVETTATVTATTTAVATATATATGSSLPPVSSADRQASWDKKMLEAPPLEVPKAVPKREQEQLENVRKRFAPLYEKVRQAWLSAPLGCKPKDASCESTWKDAAAVIGEVEDAIGPPRCGWQTGLAAIERTVVHQRFLLSLTAALQAELGDAAMKMGDPSSWPKLLQANFRPQPCLKCMAPEPTAVLESTFGEAILVPFAEGKSDIDAAAEAALKKVKDQLAPMKAGVFDVRGHADASEPGDRAALAKARAEAALAWLVNNGIDKKRLATATYGTDLPLGSSATPATRALNRRVDFELKQKAK